MKLSTALLFVALVPGGIASAEAPIQANIEEGKGKLAAFRLRLRSYLPRGSVVKK